MTVNEITIPEKLPMGDLPDGMKVKIAECTHKGNSAYKIVHEAHNGIEEGVELYDNTTVDSLWTNIHFMAENSVPKREVVYNIPKGSTNEGTPVPRIKVGRGGISNLYINFAVPRAGKGTTVKGVSLEAFKKAMSTSS